MTVGKTAKARAIFCPFAPGAFVIGWFFKCFFSRGGRKLFYRQFDRLIPCKSGSSEGMCPIFFIHLSAVLAPVPNPEVIMLLCHWRKLGPPPPCMIGKTMEKNMVNTIDLPWNQPIDRGKAKVARQALARLSRASCFPNGSKTILGHSAVWGVPEAVPQWANSLICFITYNL